MDLINKVARLRVDKKYVRIRTDYGQNFHTFYDNGFVAIGYNYVGKQRLEEEDQSITRRLIATNEDLSDENTSEKKTISRIYNMLHEFRNLRRGDVVAIPSQDSNRVAFGEIADDEIYQSIEGTLDCEYIKRRRVNWFKIVNWSDLDAKLNPLKARGDAINNVSELAEEIDIVMRNLFVKNDLAHFVINISQEEPIRLVYLVGLLQGVKTLSEQIILKYELNENINDITVKLNLQSPGFTELIKTGQALLIVAAMISVNSCSSGESGLTESEEREVMELNDEFSSELDSIVNSFNMLDVPNNNREYFRQ